MSDESDLMIESCIHDAKKALETKNQRNAERCIENPKLEGHTKIGDLATVTNVDKKTVDQIFKELPGFVFRIYGCFFRVCNTDIDNKKVTIELVNGQ